jgi:hypothetical protein
MQAWLFRSHENNLYRNNMKWVTMSSSVRPWLKQQSKRWVSLKVMTLWEKQRTIFSIPSSLTDCHIDTCLTDTCCCQSLQGPGNWQLYSRCPLPLCIWLDTSSSKLKIDWPWGERGASQLPSDPWLCLQNLSPSGNVRDWQVWPLLGTTSMWNTDFSGSFPPSAQ